MFGSIGMPELLIIMVIALIIFGPRKLPELGRSLGRSLHEFKKASNELRNTLEDEIRIEEQRDQRSATAASRATTVQDAPSLVSPAPSETVTPAPAADDTVSRPSLGRHA